mgnify:CR=1 FL=1
MCAAVQLRGIFITGTSTGVGKTHIGKLLSQALRARNIRVVPRKPVESGCDSVDGELLPADAQALMQAAAYPGELSDVCRYRFQPPLSPARAARLADTRLTTGELVRVCTHGSEDGFVLVEGAGGFYSPLTEDGLNADLAEALQLPLLLVAENRLGILNHVLLNAEAIRARRLNLAAVVLNDLDSEQHEHMDNAADLDSMLHCPVFAVGYNENSLPEELIDTLVEPVTATA